MRSRLKGGILAAGTVALLVVGAPPYTAAEGAQAKGAVVVTATAEIDGKRYDYSGPGECYYTAAGSIFNAPATMWHAMFQARGNPMGHANLAIWQVKQDRSIRLNLSVMIGNVSHDISTAQSGAMKGTAVGGAEKGPAGGRLTAEGRTANGKVVKVTMSCSRFDAPEDNGD